MPNGFFADILPDYIDGWVPIITKDIYGKLTIHRWFNWPSEHNEMADYLKTKLNEDVYFSPMLYEEPPTTTASHWVSKQHVKAVCVAWCDGDDADFDKIRVKPTTYVQSSPDHWQGYWRFSDATDFSIFDMEDLSHGLYAAHKADGMDSGWQLSKRLRVPFTMNTKPEYGLPFEVSYETDMYDLTVGEFAAEYPPVGAIDIQIDESMPETTSDDAYAVIAKVNSNVVNDLFVDVPGFNEDWSAKMYHLECELFERDCTIAEVFTVMQEASCNKYARDGRPEADLWIQVNRDFARWQAGRVELEAAIEEAAPISVPQTPEASASGLYWAGVDFLHDNETAPTNTFIDAFMAWAQSRSSQSPVEFNMAASVTLMSTVLSRYAVLPLSFGDMGLNLYMMVLGMTTQSRKTTSLNMAKRIFHDITQGKSDEYLIPDDVTSEALAEWLSGRPEKSTLFAVDEFQDMLVAAEKRGSYVSGVIPFLTKAYDGVIPGVLRKSAQRKYQPPTQHMLNFYGTGIMDQSASALTLNRIKSGFIPRCLIVTDNRRGFTPGADDVAFLNEEGRETADAGRRVISRVLKSAATHWDDTFKENRKFITAADDPRIPLHCDDDAYARWQQFAYDVTWLAADHPLSPAELFPICERLSYSTLRIAGLLAMVDKTDTINMRHILKAISLASVWVPCTEVLVREVSNNGFSKDIADVEQFVSSQKGGMVSYEYLLMKFKNKFDNPRRMTEVLQYAQSMGTLTEVVLNEHGEKKRYVKFTRQGR